MRVKLFDPAFPFQYGRVVEVMFAVGGMATIQLDGAICVVPVGSLVVPWRPNMLSDLCVSKEKENYGLEIRF